MKPKKIQLQQKQHKAEVDAPVEFMQNPNYFFGVEEQPSVSPDGTFDYIPLLLISGALVGTTIIAVVLFLKQK